jgi:DNA-binding GntR family transcriptional regulator
LLPVSGIHADLAQQYRVARNTVAKALRRLADDGLVEVVPDWGTFRARN